MCRACILRETYFSLHLQCHTCTCSHFQSHTRSPPPTTLHVSTFDHSFATSCHRTSPDFPIGTADAFEASVVAPTNLGHRPSALRKPKRTLLVHVFDVHPRSLDLRAIIWAMATIGCLPHKVWKVSGITGPVSRCREVPDRLITRSLAVPAQIFRDRSNCD